MYKFKIECRNHRNKLFTITVTSPNENPNFDTVYQKCNVKTVISIEKTYEIN